MRNTIVAVAKAAVLFGSLGSLLPRNADATTSVGWPGEGNISCMTMCDAQMEPGCVLTVVFLLGNLEARWGM